VTTGTDDALAAAMLQLAAHSEQLTGIEQSQTEHHRETTTQLGILNERADATSSRLDDITGVLSQHASVVNALDGLDRQVTSLADQIASLAADGTRDSPSYQPVPAPRWWQLTGTEREAAIDRLRAWVEDIYLPGYGHFAAMLSPCWEHHVLCLYTLDWLSELWSVLYLDTQRAASTLAAQAEWQVRLLPAAADQMAHAAAGCRHRTGEFRRDPGDRRLPP
jgi:hypothetical protein